MNKKQSNPDRGYLFNVDILIKNDSNALALQSLIEIMNQNEQVVDFRIQSGIELGEIIDNLLLSKKEALISKPELTPASLSKTNIGGKTGKELVQIRMKKQQQKPTIGPKPISLPNLETSTHIEGPGAWIHSCIKDNRLVRLTANRQGQHLDIPCRILNFDEDQQYINVYHVDEKQVYSFKLNEIDSFKD